MSAYHNVAVVGLITGETMAEYLSPVTPRIGESIEVDSIRYEVINVTHVASTKQLWRGSDSSFDYIEVAVRYDGDMAE